MTDLYSVLELSSSASLADIKKSFRRLALVHHPDKGGNAEKFKEITQAYEILSDEEKKRKYDLGGMDAVKAQPQQQSPFPFPFGVGRGFPFGFQQQPRKGNDKHLQIPITLEEVFSGCKKTVTFERDVICSSCKGKGGKDIQTCHECHGKGMKMTMRQLGPGMIQQMMVPCDKCHQGKIIKDKCHECMGNRVKKEKKTLECNVDAGTDQTVFKFPFEADQSPDITSGDVIIILQYLPHSLFQRNGHHLIMSKTLSLSESLCGFEFSFPFLDSTKKYIKSPEHELTPPTTVRVLKGCGMTSRGNLYISFSVSFPLSLPREIESKIKELFAPQISVANMNCDVVPMVSAEEVSRECGAQRDETSECRPEAGQEQVKQECKQQ
jgi:DnaJ-class molecular chaperone with C-terminal Zn finger domain